MKDLRTMLALCLLGAFALTSCSDDDEATPQTAVFRTIVTAFYADDATRTNHGLWLHDAKIECVGDDGIYYSATPNSEIMYKPIG